MKKDEGIQILSDEPLLGPAAFVEEHGGEAEEPLAEALREHALETAVGLPAARGPIDAFLRLVRRIRGRTLVEELGEHEVYLTWLHSHVPPGGQSQLRMTQQSKVGFGVKLGVMGLGLGSGRAVTIGTDKDFGQREQCMHVQHKFLVAVRAYRYDEADQSPAVQTDVIKTLGEKITTFDDCPYCFSDPAPAPDMAEPIEGEVYDLTEDAIGKSETTTIHLEDEAERDLGLNLPLGGLEITPSIAVKREVKLNCTSEFHFPGGYCFTPYRVVTEWDDLPFWGRS